MLRLNPTPCRCPTMIKNVKRRVFCMHYDQCLDIAIERHWEGFNCVRCDVKELTSWENNGERITDRDKCLDFLTAVA